ncbi:conjugal transfer protein TraF [Pelagibaculum spongiae]|uniref:Conjugal transfer protein TraF n=1 Tax=Pelagibaculum spongiae TaxID=2080658 RepID=A0A2V1GUH9_9GAMM|nr:conjugal transfer protein TraF [Pelagibaculum spongiae]PVZ69736.1 hypothetical protein DC094_10575 [Pelagibaculum spongiae]
MKKLVLLGSLCLSLSAQAYPLIHKPGALLTQGGASTPDNILTASIYNPASASIMLTPENSFRMAIWGSAGFQTEVGQIDNFEDDLDDVLDGLDSSDPAVVAKLDSTITRLAKDGYINMSFGSSIPLLPVVVKNDLLDGVLVFDISFDSGAHLSVIDDDNTVGNNPSNILTEDAAAYLVGALHTRATFGYSRTLFDFKSSELYGGLRANIHNLQLSRQLIALRDMDSVGDILDNADENLESNTKPSFDLGLLWKTEGLTLGATIYNINEPKFEFGTLNYSDTAVLTAAPTSSEYTLDRSFSVEASFESVDHSFTLTSYMDVTDHTTIFGQEQQLLQFAAMYRPQTAWLPNVRLGAEKDLEGEKLTTIGVGATWFGGFTADMAFALDTVEIDDSSLPRKFAFNIGYSAPL